jgi:hypothetical protein
MSVLSPELRSEIESRILDRTSRRVQNLAVELGGGRLVLRGEAASFHVKQLAQHGVREMLPNVTLVNEIVVA